MRPYGDLERSTYELGLKEYENMENGGNRENEENMESREGVEETTEENTNLRAFYKNALFFIDTISVSCDD